MRLCQPVDLDWSTVGAISGARVFALPQILILSAALPDRATPDPTDTIEL